MKLKLNQTTYWDSVAEKKVFSHEIDWDFLNPYLEKESKILDYGCGYGRLTRNITNHGFSQVIGIDSSKGMIERAQREMPSLDFRHNNEKRIEIPNDYFDLVCLFAVLTCIPKDSDQQELIEELKRVVKPKGLLYVSDLLINSDQRNLDRYATVQGNSYGVFRLPEGVLLRHHDLQELKNRIFADFEIIYERHFEVTTMNGNTSKAVQLIGKKTEF